MEQRIRKFLILDLWLLLVSLLVFAFSKSANNIEDKPMDTTSTVSTVSTTSTKAEQPTTTIPVTTTITFRPQTQQTTTNSTIPIQTTTTIPITDDDLEDD